MTDATAVRAECGAIACATGSRVRFAIAVGALFCVQGGATAGPIRAADGTPEAAQRAHLERGYALCKQLVGVIFPHPPDGIQQDHAGSFEISADGQTYSFTGFVRGPDRGEPHLRPYVFRNFRCTVTLDPASSSGWTLDEFRWLQYE